MAGPCRICGASALVRRWSVDPRGAEGGVDPRSFRPSSERFGEATSSVLACTVCEHGALERPVDPQQVADAYREATDEVSLRERQGQVATADRGLARLERHVAPGALLDVGAWTGSFVEAAGRRGWEARGIDPSTWAVDEGRRRGLELRVAELEDPGVEPGSQRAVAMCDVLEHLEDPHDAIARVADLLEPGGAMYLTVPDAGSRLARAMGRRWWSVLPMHLQYFTRTSMVLLLSSHGLDPVHVDTHVKVFSARYYAERLGGYSGLVGRAAVAAVERVGLADRAIAPDFRDRMEVIAVRR